MGTTGEYRMSTQPEALFLADVIDNDPCSKAHHDAAAAKLRRLHEENDALRRERDEARRTVRDAHEAGTRLTAQRDALLEALHHTAAIAHNGGLQGMNEWQALVAVRKLTLPYFVRSGSIAETHDRVRAAIKAAEEKT